MIEIHCHCRFGNLGYSYIDGRSVRLRDWHLFTYCRLRLPLRELVFRDFDDLLW